MIQMHIIGKAFLLHAYLFNFNAQLGKKSHFISGMSETMLLTAQSFRFFCSQKTRRQAGQVRYLIGSNIWCSYEGLGVFAFYSAQFTDMACHCLVMKCLKVLSWCVLS